MDRRAFRRLPGYANGLVSARASDLASVQQLFREASSINQEVFNEARQVVNTLAAVKLASALTLTGAPFAVAWVGGSVVVVTGLVAQIGFVQLGAAVTGEIIKSNDYIGQNVSGVAFQLGKYGTEKAPEKLTEHAEHVSKHALAKYEPKILFAQQRIERYAENLAGNIKGGKLKETAQKLMSAQADKALAESIVLRAERARKVVEFAEKYKVVARVPLVFAVYDLYGALTGYWKDTH